MSWGRRVALVGRWLVPLLVLAACRGRPSKSKDAGTADASAVTKADAAGARTALAAAGDAADEAPAPRASSSPEHLRRAKAICAEPSKGEVPATDAGFALLSEGKRDSAFRELRDAVRPPGTAPVSDQKIHDGLPDGYTATAGRNGWAIASGVNQPWSYVFRGVTLDAAPGRPPSATLVRRLRGRASFVPGTDLLHVVDGPGTTLVRGTTGDVVFRSVSTDAYAERSGAAAVVHTRCDGGQELVVFSGASSSRTAAVTLGPRNALETPSADRYEHEWLGWVGDEHLWMRGTQSSVVFDVSKGMTDPPPEGMSPEENDWGVIAPNLDPKRGVVVAHYGTRASDRVLSTVLIDWKERRFIRRTAEGPRGELDPMPRFSEDGEAFALRDAPCELIVFRTAELTTHRVSRPCTFDSASSGIAAFRFWPRSSTLFLEEAAGVVVLDVASGKALATYPLVPPSGRARFVSEGGAPDAKLVVEECVGRAPYTRQVQTSVGRDLKPTRTERPGTCVPPSSERRGDPLLGALANGVCFVDGEGVLPKEVCAALRGENKDTGAKRPPPAPRRK